MRRSARLSILVGLAVLLIVPISCKDPFVPAEEGSSVLMDEALVPPLDEEPFVVIDTPSGVSRIYPENFAFGWHSGLETDPTRVRYFVSLNVNKDGTYDPNFNFIADLNVNPQDYEDMWSRWYPYGAANGMGREVFIGDDETLELNKTYVFAVQAMDRRGDVTTVFSSYRNNIRRFIVAAGNSPVLFVSDPDLGEFTFLGPFGRYYVDLAPGVPVNFSWVSNADCYGGEIAGFRYGWDIKDISDPDQWATDISLDNVSAPEVAFESGTHIFYVESVDTWGNLTTGAIEITIVP